MTQDATTIEIEAEALSIPEGLTVSIGDAEEGTQILTAGQVSLPSGVTLVSDRRCSWSTSLPPRPKISPRRFRAKGEAGRRGRLAGGRRGRRRIGRGRVNRPGRGTNVVAAEPLIVGLGNPGPVCTPDPAQHLGSWSPTCLAARMGESFQSCTEVRRRGGDRPSGRRQWYSLAKPRTYMNNRASRRPAGEVLPGHRGQRDRHPRRTRHRLRQGPAEAGWRQRAAANGLRSSSPARAGHRGFQRVRIPGSAAAWAQVARRPFVLEPPVAASERAEVPTLSRAGSPTPREMLVQRGLEPAQNQVARLRLTRGGLPPGRAGNREVMPDSASGMRVRCDCTRARRIGQPRGDLPFVCPIPPRPAERRPVPAGVSDSHPDDSGRLRSAAAAALA